MDVYLANNIQAILNKLKKFILFARDVLGCIRDHKSLQEKMQLCSSVRWNCALDQCGSLANVRLLVCRAYMLWYCTRSVSLSVARPGTA